MAATVFTGTPTLSVSDNRGIAVRTLNWNRTAGGADAALLITQLQVPDDRFTTAFRDPRLFAAWQADSTGGANLTTWASLAGQPLRRDSTDSGQNITLYDAAGRPAWARDPAGTVTTWSYDELSRPLRVMQQVSGAEEAVDGGAFIYGDNDAQTPNPQDNNLRGVCVRQYDEGGLLTIDSVALSGAVLSTSQVFLLNAEALPDWADEEADRAALLETTPCITLTTADALGRMTGQTDASGHKISQTYDISGVPITQTVLIHEETTPLPLLDGLTLSAAGQVLTESAGNGVETTYSYEPQTLRLSTIVAVRSSDNTILQSAGYTWDPVGNVTAVNDATVSLAWYRNQSTDGSRTFAYDALYQLTSATGRENDVNGAQSWALPAMASLNSGQYKNYTRVYTYDDSGNLSTLTHTGAVGSTMVMVTDNLSNRSVRQNSSGSLTPSTLVWDDWFTPGGQLRSLQTEGGKPQSGYVDSIDSLVWDRNTRLQSVTILSRSSTDPTQNDREVYQYRGGGRVRKQTRTLTNSETGLWTVSEVRYLPGLELRNTWQETAGAAETATPDYSEQLEVVTTQAGRNQIRVLHWVSTPPSGISNNAVRYGVDDNIGSVQLELDNEGQLISREEYYPFGGTAVWAGRSQTEADYKTIRYSGKERDGTGLYYYGYRYYAPWLCRWTAADPGHEIDGLNLFRMVRNNPVSFIDNAGLAPTKLSDKDFQEMLPAPDFAYIRRRTYGIRRRSNDKYEKPYELNRSVSLPDLSNKTQKDSENPVFIGFHGTNEAAVKNMLENGLDIDKIPHGQIGQGFYIAKDLSLAKGSADPSGGDRKALIDKSIPMLKKVQNFLFDMGGAYFEPYKFRPSYPDEIIPVVLKVYQHLPLLHSQWNNMSSSDMSVIRYATQKERPGIVKDVLEISKQSLQMVIPSEEFYKVSLSRDDGRRDTGAWYPAREFHIYVPGNQVDLNDPIDSERKDIHSFIRNTFNELRKDYIQEYIKDHSKPHEII